ncbi:MAG: methyltransferase domain-containing protein [Xanthomonadales bacterium]|nr:methyltransferase domain-containing protein [Xanthomonadales bacterium]
MTGFRALLCLLIAAGAAHRSHAGDFPVSEVVEKAMQSPYRIEEDFERDKTRHPGEVLTFVGIEPGMTVLDLFSGGGYYTTLISGIVGDDGAVTAHNNAAYLPYAGEELEKRKARGTPANVQSLIAEANDLELPESHYDAVMAVLTWHDFYYVDPENGWPAIDAEGMVRKLCRTLKPGGVLGVVDHAAESGADVRETAQNLHRIDPARVRSDLQGDCFEYTGEIGILANPRDDHSLPMFDEGIRGQTDRFVYRFRKISQN